MAKAERGVKTENVRGIGKAKAARTGTLVKGPQTLGKQIGPRHSNIIREDNFIQLNLVKAREIQKAKAARMVTLARDPQLEVQDNFIQSNLVRVKIKVRTIQDGKEQGNGQDRIR